MDRLLFFVWVPQQKKRFNKKNNILDWGMSRCLSLRWKFNKPKHMKIPYDILFMCKYILYIITYMQPSYASYRCYFSFFLCSFCSYKFLPSSNEPASRTRKTILLQLDKLTASSTNIKISKGAAQGGRYNSSSPMLIRWFSNFKRGGCNYFTTPSRHA